MVGLLLGVMTKAYRDALSRLGILKDAETGQALQRDDLLHPTARLEEMDRTALREAWYAGLRGGPLFYDWVRRFKLLLAMPGLRPGFPRRQTGFRFIAGPGTGTAAVVSACAK